jgi:hypothetical protein
VVVISYAVTVLATGALPIVFTDAGASTVFANEALPIVFTDAGASTVLAMDALPIVFTDAGPSTVFANGMFSTMWAESIPLDINDVFVEISMPNPIVLPCCQLIA